MKNLFCVIFPGGGVWLLCASLFMVLAKESDHQIASQDLKTESDVFGEHPERHAFKTT
jgi:hypothetical protein